MGSRIRVLVVDDSALVRAMIQSGLEEDPDIEVVGCAADPYAARDLILALDPDVMTLDVEMPRMSGLEFLRKLMPQHPMPVVMVSAGTRRGARTALDALEAGAVDIVAKASADIPNDRSRMMEELRAKVRGAAGANLGSFKGTSKPIRDSGFVQYRKSHSDAAPPIIAIGASTGGPEAIAQVIRAFPPNMPGIVIVQHMPAGYTARFAARLDAICAMRVKEAQAGDRIEPGTILLAPGDEHLIVRGRSKAYRVELHRQDKVCGHRPSVEVLFRSVAEHVGKSAVGVLLTGMGHDGAEGLLAMRRAGAGTIAQDEATSLVFGMPKAAIANDGAERVVPLDQISSSIVKLLGKR